MTPKLRLAPSLSGYMPLDSARLALLTSLWAGRERGTVLLRLDDLDPRDAAHAEDAERDLRWLGLAWDSVVRQSDRAGRYAEAAAALERAGRLYPCFESEDELRAKRDARARRNQPTQYDRAMLRMTPAQRAEAEAKGKQPYWRFLLSPEPVGWNDAVLGRTHVDLAPMSDPVLVRADGTPLPLFAGVIDDLDAGATHLVQTDELRGATAIALDIARALGADVRTRQLAHVPPLAGADRVTLRRLRTDGIEPAAIVACLAPEPFDMAQVTAEFDIERLRDLNRNVLSALPFAKVQPRLPAGATEAFWLAVRSHLDLLTEARGWWDVVAGTIVPPVMEGEGAYLRAAIDKLPSEPWNGTVWADWTAAVMLETGRIGDALEAPLRLALTGEDHGPDPADLLPLIGRARAAQRLEVAAA